MSFKDNPCRKFQANIFNKSKCQNCFKPRESHLLNDEDLNQAKPIYGGWLLLAPEGTNFDNPLHRSRKWQRRFFILYEHGLLRYALDEMPSTLPQGTINMNQCSDVIDGETRTGQKNSLCILTSEKEHFIRAECKEIINGWQEALTVYPRTNKQNQKKKRKVDPPTQQEPGPAKVTVTSSSSGGSIPCLPSSIASAERVPMSRATLWQEESRWSRATIPCSRSASCLSQLSQSQPDSSITTQDDGGTMSTGRKVRVESGYFSLEKTKSEPSPQSAQHSQPPQPPQHLPLSSSASSSSLGAPSPRYSSESEPQTSPYQPSQDPLPSPGALVSPSYSTISSSQSSLDSDPSGTTPTWEGCGGGGGGSANSVSGGGGRVGRSGREYAALSDVPRARRLSYREAFRSEKKRQELRARTRSPGREEVARLFGEERRRSQIIGRFEEGQNVERMDTSSSNEPSTNTNLIQRQGRSERRISGKDRSVPDVSSSTFANLRRAKSLDRRVTESSMTPDLLNFKKGWMTKLYEDGMWKKHWFVLTDQSLRYYKDSIAEEASELDGEIDLSTCYDVKEFPVQRNYGFQILCKEGACTLSAMTSGIRRNWIQAIMKNVRPTIAPDVTRKNISLKLSVLKPRSLPDEKIKAQVMLEPCPQPPPEPSPSPEAPKSDVHRQPAGNIASEPRKSRVRERRPEGRSKTFDWSEFKMEQTERPVKERADTVDLSSSFSTTSSYCSPSSSPSSLASSPVSTSSLQTSSISGAHPPSMTEEAEKENARRGVPPHSMTSATHMPNTVTVTVTSTLNTTPPVQPSMPESQEQGKMEVDHPTTMHPASEDQDNRTSDVHEEIEQRWHQVETTPLREEKQVPITTALGNSANSDRLPAHELAALLDKELGQKQKELDRLQKQNNLLKEQLEDALGREQSAREGYVLQNATPPSSSPHRVPWQRLHKLNQDLQGELEAQKRKQDLAQQQIRTLKRSYTEAQDAVDRHESDIQALQSKLASAMAEILASEQAVARMRNELKLEQERSKEQEAEYGQSEATLRAQLKDSEDRLREVEASLLERNQALRHLERQQALQRDHMREVQRLQERLQEVTARLTATEEGQALKEERLRKEQHSMQESHERERQNLCRRLAEAETAQKEMEERLLEAEQQVEALLRGRQTSGECKEQMLKLQEELAQKIDMVESLRESVRRLEEEKSHLTCRCQELLNQIAEADREVNKLRNRLETEEADYYTLEHSYERATQEFQKMSQFLREKEEEIRQTKEMYERLVERKEEDLKEALVKMTALGNSLEETEQKLQAKEELLCQMSQSLLDKVGPCSAEKDLQAKLVVAEDRIAELEQHLNALQLGYADLRMERQQIPEQGKKGRVKTSAPLAQNAELSLSFDNTSKTEISPDDKESQVKRSRIRFSSIQCQKYISLEGLVTGNVSSTSADAGQKVDQDVNEDICLDEGNISSDITYPHSSDPEKFISIIHALETKLLATEDKLRNLTQNLEEQRSTQAEDMSKIDLKMTEKKHYPEKELSCGTETHSNAASKHYAKALVCVENSREKVRAILSGSHDTTGSQLHSLSEIENDLFNASLYIQQGQKTLEEQTPVVHQNQTPETLDKDALHLFAKTLSFEAVVLNKMALLIQTSKSDILQALAEIWEDIETIKRSDKDCLAIVYADVLTRKLMLESAFWKELEKAETDVAKCKEGSVSADVDVDATIFNTFIKAELAYSIQNLKLCYEEKFKILQRELTEALNNLHQREMALKAIIEAAKRPDLKNVIKEVKNNFGFSKQKLADIRPPELAPYMEQIEMETARDLAEEIVDKHLAREMPSCGVDSIETLQNAHDTLANELQRQAAILNKYAQEIESGGNHPGLAKMVHALFGHQTSRNLTSTSLCMREALIQSQVAYVACRLRAMHEQDLGWCKQTSQDMDALVQQHARSVTAIQEKYESSLQEERINFSQTMTTLQMENQTLKSEISKRVNQLSQQQEQLALLEERYQKDTEDLNEMHKKELRQVEQGRTSTELALMETTADSQRKLEVLLVGMDTMEERHESHVRKLEEQFEQRICELRRIHKEEIEKLHFQYVENIQCVKEHLQSKKDPEVSHLPSCDDAVIPMEEEEQGKGQDAQNMSEVDSMVVLKDRIQELETQMNTMRDELENKHLEGDVASLREKYQRDFESLKATCERGFAAMEETHHKVIEDLQRQHQREISKLMEERERLLAEETAATIAAIEAMKNAHKEELEKTQRSQLSGLNSDIDELRLQYEEELQSIQRELEVLSEQYSQKCLENAHLAQALEAERQALRQCQRENQELNAHNQELNNRLSAEITRMRSCFSGETALSPLTQGKDVYELEVLLRIKESEIQYLKQEIHSLKDELQSALRDKKYATDKYKDIYTELSIVKAKADCDISKLKEKLLIATEALGERTVDGTVTSGYDIMKSKSNPDFIKKEQSTSSKQLRGVRSKSLKEGLTVQERMKLFEAKDSKKI
ncbi:rootletin isoform X4 [Lates calcarifer]|uniref:Rootletin isoform X4 n=2 Tax=Lates calcarifer TaxID=8187 RepID=A0AAJ8DKI4_LATCA|nr:rootletin isoform X4 [Lates calcarifer]